MTSWTRSVAEPMNMGGFELKLLDVDARTFLPVFIICGILVLLTALWVLGVWVWLASRHNCK
ncbi:hypothetical protein ACFL6U_30965 [Planctomycetota bacterium]